MRKTHSTQLLFSFIIRFNSRNGICEFCKNDAQSEQDITLPLFGFNVGLELGQIVVVAIALFIHYIFSEVLKLSNKIWIYIISVPIFIFALKWL